MARFAGKIGFAKTSNTEPAIWEETYIERKYYGDIQRSNFRVHASDKANDDLTISNTISIVADNYACTEMYAMRYVIINGVKWSITSIDEQPPRLILSLGGVYNAQPQNSNSSNTSCRC